MTMGPDHERWEDAAGTYVLGALPDDERAGYEAHLADLPGVPGRGRRAARRRRGAAGLAAADAAAARAEGADHGRGRARGRAAGLRRPADAREPAAPKREAPLALLASACPRVAALACVALLVGARRRRARCSAAATAARTIAFESDACRRPRRSSRSATTARRSSPTTCPPAPAGKTYMVWLKRPGHAPEPTSALFTPRRDGSATASVTGDLDGVEAVLVNIEPLGGSTTPTSDPSS